MARQDSLCHLSMPRRVVLYGKPGCHLCSVVELLLLGLRKEFELVVLKVDISKDPLLLQEYGVRIPVVVIDGRTTLDAPIRVQDLREALSGSKT